MFPLPTLKPALLSLKTLNLKTLKLLISSQNLKCVDTYENSY